MSTYNATHYIKHGIVPDIKGQWIDHCGRQVFKHKIDNTQYVPTNAYGGNSTWYLMVEMDGKSWIWDGMIEEG
jgi:hypothetical protein